MHLDKSDATKLADSMTRNQVSLDRLALHCGDGIEADDLPDGNEALQKASTDYDSDHLVECAATSILLQQYRRIFEKIGMDRTALALQSLWRALGDYLSRQRGE